MSARRGRTVYTIPEKNFWGGGAPVPEYQCGEIYQARLFGCLLVTGADTIRYLFNPIQTLTDTVLDAEVTLKTHPVLTETKPVDSLIITVLTHHLLLIFKKKKKKSLEGMISRQRLLNKSPKEGFKTEFRVKATL